MYFLVLFKRTLLSSEFSFFVFKNHIINIIQIVIIKLRFNNFLCFFPILHFIIFLKNDLINWNVNNRIIILLPVKFIYVCSLVTTVLSRPTFRIIRTKVSQDFAFIWLMPGSNYPLDDMNIFLCAFQHTHSSWSKYLIRRIILFLAWCFKQGWHIP